MPGGFPDKTRLLPLKEGAWKALENLARGPVPSKDINMGVVNRLSREGLIASTDLPSPYKTVKGNVLHYIITEAGRRKLASKPGDADR